MVSRPPQAIVASAINVIQPARIVQFPGVSKQIIMLCIPIRYSEVASNNSWNEARDAPEPSTSPAGMVSALFMAPVGGSRVVPDLFGRYQDCAADMIRSVAGRCLGPVEVLNARDMLAVDELKALDVAVFRSVEVNRGGWNNHVSERNGAPRSEILGTQLIDQIICRPAE